MEVAFFKCRCFICFKSFEVPSLPDSTYGQWLFSNQEKKYFTYSLGQSENLELAIQETLVSSKKLQIENDNTKGDTFVKLIALASNENSTPILGYNKCPRCGSKLHSNPNTKIGLKEIRHLSFPKSKDEINEKLKRAITQV